MPDPKDNFLEALKGNTDERLPVRVKKSNMGRMPLTAALLGEQLPSQEQAGNALLKALEMGMADKEIASEGRLADPRPLEQQPPVTLEDGTIEAGYDPLINAPGVLGDLKKDELVEERARKAVEYAQSQGIRTVSSGFDEGTGLGWAIGIDGEGKTVKVQAKPDDPPDAYGVRGALEPDASPDDVYGSRGALDPSVPAPPVPPMPSIDLGSPEVIDQQLERMGRPLSRDEQFDRAYARELAKRAGIDTMTVSGGLATGDLKAPDAPKTKKVDPQRAKLEADIEALPPSVLVLASQLANIGAPRAEREKLVGLALEQQRRDRERVAAAEAAQLPIGVSDLLGAGRFHEFVDGSLPLKVEWDDRAEGDLRDLSSSLRSRYSSGPTDEEARFARTNTSPPAVGQDVWIGDRKAKVLEIDGDEALINFHAGPDPRARVPVKALSRVAPVSDFEEDLPAVDLRTPEEQAAAAQDKTPVIDLRPPKTRGAIDDPDLVKAAQLILAKRAVWEREYADFHNRKVNPFADIPVLDEMYKYALAPAVRGAAQFVDTVSMGLIPLSEMGSDEVKESLDTSGGVVGRVTQQMAGGAATAAGLAVPFGAANRLARAVAPIKALETPIAFSAFDTAAQVARNLKEGKPLLEQADEAALHGAKNGIILGLLGLGNRALLSGMEAGRVKGGLEAALNGVEFMALVDPEAFKDPAFVAGMLGTFTVQGALHTQGQRIAPEAARNFLLDATRPERLGVQAPPEVSTMALSETLATRVNLRAKNEGLKTKEDVAKAAREEIDAALEALIKPEKHTSQDILAARGMLNEIAQAEMLIMGAGITGGRSLNPKDIPAGMAELGLAGGKAAAQGTGWLFWGTVNPVLRGAGQLERLFHDPKTGKPTALGKPFDALANLVVGEQGSLASLLETGLKRAGQGLSSAVAKIKGKEPQDFLDRGRGYFMTATSRGGSEWGAILREGQAERRYTGPEITYRDVQELQRNPETGKPRDVSERTRVLARWSPKIDSSSPEALRDSLRGRGEEILGPNTTVTTDQKGRPWDITDTVKHLRHLGIDTRAVDWRPKDDAPVSERPTENIGDLMPGVKNATNRPPFLQDWYAHLSKRLMDLREQAWEDLPPEQKAINSRRQNEILESVALIDHMYKMRRMGFSPSPVIENGKIKEGTGFLEGSVRDRLDALTRSDAVHQDLASLLRTMADPKSSLFDVNMALSSTAIIMRMGERITEKMTNVPPEYMGRPGAEYAINYTTDASGRRQLMSEPLVLRDNPGGEMTRYNKVPDIIVPGLSDLYVRTDLHSDIRMFAGQQNTLTKFYEKIIGMMRFGKIVASPAGAVRDAMGDAYLTYLDLGPAGLADVYRAGGWGSQKAAGWRSNSRAWAERAGETFGLPTAREIFHIARELGTGDLLTSRDRATAHQGDPMAPSENSLLNVGRRLIEQGVLHPEQFHNRLMSEYARLNKLSLDQVESDLAEIRTQIEGKKGMRSSTLEFAKDYATKAPGEVLIMRDWLIAEAAHKMGVVGSTAFEVELRSGKDAGQAQDKFVDAPISASERLASRRLLKREREAVETLAASVAERIDRSRTGEPTPKDRAAFIDAFVNDAGIKRLSKRKDARLGDLKDLAEILYDRAYGGNRDIDAAVEGTLRQHEQNHTTIKEALGRGGDAWNAVWERAIRMRSMPDNYTKLGAWLTYLARGQVEGEVLDTPQKAAKRVATFYADYSQIPFFFKSAGKASGGLGVNFFSESVRLLSNHARRHPWRLALAYMAPQMAWAAAKATGLTHLSDDEIKEIERSRGLMTFPIPGTKRFVDLTPAVPGADLWNNSITRLFNPTKPYVGYGTSGPVATGRPAGVELDAFDAAGAFIHPWIAPFTEGSPWLAIGIPALFGRDPSKGFREIPDEDRWWGTDGVSGAFEPGFWTQGRNIVEAATEDTDKDGRPLDKVGIVSRSVGVGATEVNKDLHNKDEKRIQAQLMAELRERQNAVRAIAQDKRLSSEEQDEKINEIIDRYEGTIAALHGRLNQLYTLQGKPTLVLPKTPRRGERRKP